MDITQPLSQAVERAVEILSPRAEAIFGREPLIDPDLPTTSDIDLLVFGPVDGILPERLYPDPPGEGGRSFDLIWLPLQSLRQPEKLAANGLIAHRLLGSRLLYDRTEAAQGQQQAVRDQMYRPEIQNARITGFFDMGFYTVREIGVTWDFPSLALFWALIAHTACLAALADGLGQLCPNIYTRPFTYLRSLERDAGFAIETPFIDALHLDAGPPERVEALRRIHTRVRERFPEPEWPANMRSATRYEYRYFLSRDELEWRIRVAEEMIQRGEQAAAVYYLRFIAYMVACLPMVHARAQEGIDVSFVRPQRAVRPDLERHCPEILDDLDLILRGRDPVTRQAVQESLARLAELRAHAELVLRSKGIVLEGLRPWAPYSEGG